MTIDNVYDSFLYDEQFYGADADERTLWGVQIDWGGDVLNVENQASFVTGVRTQRGRNFFLKLNSENEAVAFQPVRLGSCIITIDDPAGRYNPFNASSDLYPNVEAGKDIRITVRVSPDGERKTVFTGTVMDVNYYSVGNRNYAKITAVENLQQLSDTSIRTPIQQDVKVSDAVSLTLDAAEWPGARRRVTESDLVIPFWSEDRRTLTAINDLTDTECGYFFIDRDGKATYYSQYYEPPVVASFDESELIKNVVFSSPFETIRNRLRVAANPVTLGSETTIWELGDKPPLAIGETREIWASYVVDNQRVSAIDVVTPVATTDYTANEEQDGSGADLTAQISVSFAAFGQTAKITIANQGFSRLFITSLKIRGKPLLQLNQVFSENVLSSGNRLFFTDTRFRQETSYTSELAAWLSSFLPYSRNYPQVEIEARPDKQFSFDLFDRIQISATSAGLTSTNYGVGEIQHEWTVENGQATRTTVKLEPSRAAADNSSGVVLRFPPINETKSVVFPPIARINGLPSISVSLWVYLNNFTLSQIARAIGWNDFYRISFEKGVIFSSLRIWRAYTGGDEGVWSAIPVPEDEWVNIIITDYTDKVYINGNSVTVNVLLPGTGAPLSTENAILQIGDYIGTQGVPPSAFSDYYIRDIKIYNRALTAAEAAVIAGGGDVASGLRLSLPVIRRGTEAEYNGVPVGNKPLYAIPIWSDATTVGGVIAYDNDYDPST